MASEQQYQDALRQCVAALMQLRDSYPIASYYWEVGDRAITAAEALLEGEETVVQEVVSYCVKCGGVLGPDMCHPDCVDLRATQPAVIDDAAEIERLRAEVEGLTAERDRYRESLEETKNELGEPGGRPAPTLRNVVNAAGIVCRALEVKDDE